MSNQQSDNGVSPIIDALLMRMSELDRFSDDERVIAGRELLPLDVVVDECGDFGFVSTSIGYSVNEEDDLCWGVAFVGLFLNELTHDDCENVRTIYETEGTAARAYLAKYLGGRKWF